MASLTDVYERGVGIVASRRRVYFGLTLFAVGAAMVVSSIVVATTGMASEFDLGTFEARELAGVLAGLGVPAAFLGSFALLPSGRRTHAAALIGGSLTVLGVTLFRAVYPRHWVGSSASPDFTLPVVVVYFVGAITTFWCLFLAVANVKRRNDPGGTVRMEVTEEGTTRILEVTGSVPGLGGIGGVGLFGTDPEGDVETQTNRETVLYEESPTASRAANDGGSAARTADGDAVEPASEEVARATRRGRPDAYCGNCEHFRYVRVDGDIEPACILHEEIMDDMDACEEWEANR